MIWIVAYREDERTSQLAVNGRAAAIVAAIGMIERGIEVLSVTDETESKSVSDDEFRRVSELSHAPSVQSLFRATRRDGGHSIPASIPEIRKLASAHQETEVLKRRAS